MKMYQIDFYKDQKGHSDVTDYIRHLNRSNQKQDKQVLTKLSYQLEMLSILGNRMKMPQTKYLRGYRHPLMELRPLPERVFYASWKKNRYVMLSHYTKKSNKTNPREIVKALDRLDDWLERKK